MENLLIGEGNCVLFQIEVTEKHTHRIEFNVYEVVAWEEDSKTPYKKDLYLKGEIKWDGCSHIWFMDDGYLHLCGLGNWGNHSNMMKALFEFGKNNIEAFDKEIAGYV